MRRAGHGCSDQSALGTAQSRPTPKLRLLQRATTYHELGPDYFDKRNTVRATHRLVKRLEALGQGVILEPRFMAAPSG